MPIELLTITPHAEHVIEQAGRTAYQSERSVRSDSAGPFIKKLISLGHESVLEHASATFRFSGVSRAMTHQLVRHRLVAYTQKSQRYVSEDNFKYVTPPSMSTPGSLKDAVADSTKGYKQVFVSNLYIRAMAEAREFYTALVKQGVPKEDARFVLPNATETEIVVSANFRQWRHMIKLRTSKHAQWEIRGVFKKVLYVLYEWCPNVFEDLNIRSRDEEDS